jgi:hypothetical protein
MSASALLAPGTNDINAAFLWVSGNLTLNGTTPVVVSAPYIGANDNVVLTRTGAASDNGVALVAIVAGTSFSVVSNAADTGTIRWTVLRAPV